MPPLNSQCASIFQCHRILKNWRNCVASSITDRVLITVPIHGGWVSDREGCEREFGCIFEFREKGKLNWIRVDGSYCKWDRSVEVKVSIHHGADVRDVYVCICMLSE